MNETNAQDELLYESEIEWSLEESLTIYNADPEYLGSIVHLPQRTKFGAIVFTIATGPLGGHRIYLGTNHKVPLAYTLTLGGAGIIPFVDLCQIIFSKDLKKFENKSQVIMWVN